MKRIFSVVSCMVLCLALAGVAGAAEINYKIKVLDNPIVDLNNKGAVITDDALIRPNGDEVSLVCPGSDAGGLDNTVPNKLNDPLQVIGYCFQPGIGDVGFIRNRNGSYDFIHPVGSHATFLFGVNDNIGSNLGVVGQTFDGNYHGLLCVGLVCQTIDFPVADSQTACLGVTNNLIAVCAYFTFDPVTNAASEWTGFLWSNGSFFPFDRPGAAWAFPIDVNESDLILAVSSIGGFQGGPSFPQGEAFINDDHTIDSLGFPATVDGFDASFITRGLNNKGQLGGALVLRFCQSPFNCQFFPRGFIATPKPAKK